MARFLVDQPLHFAIPARDCRGRIVRLDGVLNDILHAHDYPQSIRNVLAEALALTALLGSLLKDERGQMTMQAQNKDAVVTLLACDFKDGELRGYADFDRQRLAELGPYPSLMALFGKAYLAITFDPPLPAKRYQGIVPLEGESLAQALAFYFVQSEQVPSFIQVALHGSGDAMQAAAFLVQHLPEGEEGRERLHVRLEHPNWEHVAVMSASLTDAELLDAALSGEELLWRLFSESDEVRVLSGKALVKGCRCNPDHIREVLSRFTAGEREEMANDAGVISVDCAFCSRIFPIHAASLSN